MSESLPRKAPTYRPFRSDDIAAAHVLSLAMGWPHRADDWRFMLDTGSGFVAEDNGSVIGTALWWKFGEGCGTLGLVIVSAQEQQRGIGRKLMELLLEALGNRVTFLYATPAGKPLYEKLGFDELRHARSASRHDRQRPCYRAVSWLPTTSAGRRRSAEDHRTRVARKRARS